MTLPTPALRFAVVGPGRAGESFRRALIATGAECIDVVGRLDDPGRLDPTIDLVLITTQDHAIASIAALVPVGPMVVHVSGATTLAPLLAHHERCGSIHPLLSLPDPERGAALLLDRANLAIAGADGDAVRELLRVAERLEAVPFIVDDADRARYHAAASIAANHLVGLTAQVERIATTADLPLAPFLTMMRAVLDNVERTSVAASLTGPVARADWATVDAHLEAIDPNERNLYLTLASACARVAGHSFPFSLGSIEPNSSSEEQP